MRICLIRYKYHRFVTSFRENTTTTATIFARTAIQLLLERSYFVVASSSSVYSVCSNCKHPPKKGEDLKHCSRCQFTRYCSEQCQRKDWDFHQFSTFARSVVAKKSDTVKA